MFRKIILLVIIVIAISFTKYCTDNNLNYKLSEEDENEIMRVVNQYYTALENRNFYDALEVCNFKDNNIDLKSRILALEEIWGNIIVDFNLEQNASKIEYSKESKAYVVDVSYEIKYKDTTGGSVKEIIYLVKNDKGWKISIVRGLDRYGFYRTGEYQYDRLIYFLDPKGGN